MILGTSFQDKLFGDHLALLNSKRDNGFALWMGLRLAGWHISPIPSQPMLAGLA